jgi:hypothetical protein
MRRLSLRRVLVVAVAVASGSACSSESTGTPTTPSTPTAITETFSGTLTLNGAVTFPFVANQAGSANATIRALEPHSTITTSQNGAGSFLVGETVFQGPSLAEATATGIVYGWNGTTGALSLNSLVGVFAPDTAITGATSGARRTGGSPAATVIGIALGTWSGTTCSIVLANDVSGIGSSVTGAVQGAGSLCARVYDVGKLHEAAKFTIEAAHF